MTQPAGTHTAAVTARRSGEEELTTRGFVEILHAVAAEINAQKKHIKSCFNQNGQGLSAGLLVDITAEKLIGFSRCDELDYSRTGLGEANRKGKADPFNPPYSVAELKERLGELREEQWKYLEKYAGLTGGVGQSVRPVWDKFFTDLNKAVDAGLAKSKGAGVA